MNTKPRLIGLLVAATLILTLAVAIEASALLPAEVPQLPMNGFGAGPMLLFDLLLLITVVFFLLAPFLAQNRLVLVQAIANAAYGLAMIVGGVLVALAGLATLFKLLALLLAIPFGTIAYFIEYGCGAQELGPGLLATVAGWMGADCFDATRVAIVLGLVLKIAGLAALLGAAVKFVKVRGLIILFALSGALSFALVFVLMTMADLAFLLHPVDAVLTIVVGVIAVVYGIVVLLKGLFALAMAIAAQVA